MYYCLIAIGIIIVAILVLSGMYVSENYTYLKIGNAYTNVRPLDLPRGWSVLSSPENVDSITLNKESGMALSPGAVSYNGHPALKDTYGVGYTDERGWYS
jgi:hypothetical protein